MAALHGFGGAQKREHIGRRLRHHRDFTNIGAPILHAAQAADDFRFTRRLLEIVVAQHHRHAVRLGRSDCGLHALIAGKQFDVD